MDRFFRYIFTVALVGLLWSCNDDMDGVIGDGTVTLNINARIEQVEAESRAVLSDAAEVNGVQSFSLYIYNGTTSDAKLIHCQDVAQFPFSVTLGNLSSNTTYGAVLLGNSTVSNLGSYAIVGTSTLGDLNNATFTVSTHYNIPGTSPETNPSTDPDLMANDAAAKKFTWSGYAEFTMAQPNMSFVLNPNMAKLKITVNNNTKNNANPNDIIDIVSVHIKNVRDKVLRAQNALSDCGQYVEPSGLGLTSYIVENLELAPGKSRTRSYYIPHNEVATGGKVRPDAPANATYIEVKGRRKSDNLWIAYRIYPGTKVNNSQFDGNFHIVSDHKYNITININSDGITYDGSVNVPTSGKSTEAVNKVSLPGGHNCYMIHPKISNTSNGTVYELPIHQQINRFWQSKSWYSGEANEINDNTEWVAEVIWQDINARAIHFCDANGNYTTSNHNTYNGVGKNPVYFVLDKTTVANSYDALMSSSNFNPYKDIYGNVVVGIKYKPGTANASRETGYLWSYHLWITDYNPDAVPSPSYCLSSYNNNDINGVYAQNSSSNLSSALFLVDRQGQQSYNSTTLSRPGNVQHYNHLYSAYWGANTTSDEVWDGSGMYANKWIMDRNLGAQAPSNLDIKNPTEAYGLYYQFGRKDPFSYHGTYNIEGASRSNYNTGHNRWETSSGGTISNGVRNPLRFYTGIETTWASDASYSNPWYSIESQKVGRGEKTIFDPCPPGWCVPVSDTFDFGQRTYKGTNTYTNLISQDAFNTDRATFVVFMDNGPGTVDESKLRHMAVLISTLTRKDGNGTLSKRVLDASFPMQGYIPQNGVGFSGIEYYSTDSRGEIWCVEPNGQNRANLYDMRALGAYTGLQSDYDLHITDSRSSGRSTYRHAGKLTKHNDWPASRGQNVRCIQEPYK